MCEPPQQQTKTTHSTPSLHLQFHPSTPEKSISFSSNPTPLKQTQQGCFKCGQLDHWYNNCPQKYPNNNNNKPFVPSPGSRILCRCGYGFCEVRDVKNAKNFGKQYFVCPIKRGARCKDFVKWCHESIKESDLQPPLFKYPECECGAGVCRRVPCGLKSYFVCPIKEKHGSCGYRVSEDEVLNNARMNEEVNNTSIVPIRQSRQRSLNEFIEGDLTDAVINELANNLGEDSDFLLTTKRKRITDNSENPSPVAVPEIPEGNCGASPIEETNSQPDGFPDIEFEDDIESINLASWQAIEGEAYLLSRMSTTPSSTSSRQSLFQRDIFAADAPFGIFPSFNPIVAPKQTSILNSESACNNFTVKTPNQCTQLSTNVVSPNGTPGSESKIKERRQREIAKFAQQQLLNDLEDLGFHEHESMREAAEATFSTLNLLGFECKQFSDYVWDFIDLVASMAETDKSVENSSSLEELNKFLEGEKVKLANIQDDCMNTEALLEESNQKRNLLCEEVSCLEAMLVEKRNELEVCESETTKIETQLGDMKRRMLEVDITVKDKTRRAEKKIAARAALEKAKHALEN